MSIVSAIFPTLSLIFLGWLAARIKAFKQDECETLSKFSFNYAIPTLLFVGTAKANLPVDGNWNFLLSFYLGLFALYFIAIVFAKTVFSLGSKEQSVFALCSTYSNTTILGVPLCHQILGKDSLLPLFVIISIQNLVLFSIGIISAERDSASREKIAQQLVSVVKHLLSSPITLSLILGLVVNLVEIPIYAPLWNSLSLFSQIAIPMALFVMGTALNQYQISGKISLALMASAFKLVLLPLLVGLFAYKVFEIKPLWANTAVLASAMPVGVSAYIFAKKYNTSLALSASSIVISTLLSIVSISLLAAFMQQGAQ